MNRVVPDHWCGPTSLVGNVDGQRPSLRFLGHVPIRVTGTGAAEPPGLSIQLAPSMPKRLPKSQNPPAPAGYPGSPRGHPSLMRCASITTERQNCNERKSELKLKASYSRVRQLVLLLCLLLSSVSARAADFYVATDGNDSWSGTVAEANPERPDGPFRSWNTVGSYRSVLAQNGEKSNDIVAKLAKSFGKLAPIPMPPKLLASFATSAHRTRETGRGIIRRIQDV